MGISQRATALVTWLSSLMMMLAVTACSSPTSPSTMATVSTVALSATTVTVGSTVQATVSLKAVTVTAVTIAVSSSNPAVATVQTSITIPAGALSATITVTGAAPGTASITASLNASSSQSPTLSVTSAAALSALSLSASSVVGGQSVTGTVVLIAAAPAGGVVVLLSGGDPVTVPASVSVPAGFTSATFTIVTRAVGGTVSVTIGASSGGVSASAVLSVTRPTVATASFGVTGPTLTETCTLTNSGHTLDCTFNGSDSTAPGTITAWDWSYSVATTFARTTTGPVLTMPTVNCSLLPPPPLPPGEPWFTLIVTLTIHDSLGNVSAKAIDNGARLFPQGVCGF